MIFSLNDPESIVQWWMVWPERHDTYLDYKMKADPQFAGAIRQAQRLIAARPELRAIRARLTSKSRTTDQGSPSDTDPQLDRPTYKDLLTAG